MNIIIFFLFSAIVSSVVAFREYLHFLSSKHQREFLESIQESFNQRLADKNETISSLMKRINDLEAKVLARNPEEYIRVKAVTEPVELTEEKPATEIPVEDVPVEKLEGAKDEIGA